MRHTELTPYEHILQDRLDTFSLFVTTEAYPQAELIEEEV